MTTGTFTTGQTTWQAPPGYVLSGCYTAYRWRSWSGGDSPAALLSRNYEKEGYDSIRFRVRKGRTYTYVVKRYRLVRRSKTDPKRARLQENSYSCTFEKRDTPIFYASFLGYAQMTEDSYQSYIASGATVDRVRLQLIGKLREKVAGSDFNAGVFLGEGREALSMIASSARRIALSLTALKRGDIAGVYRHLLNKDTKRRVSTRGAELSQIWLEAQYGWLPLLKDAEDGAKFLAHQFSVPLQQVIRVSSRRSDLPPRQQIAQSGNYWWGKSDIITDISIKAILREKDVVSLSGLMDPLSVAWELLPYSFVADWFIPIGNYLSARGLAQSLTGTFVETKYDRVSSSDPRVRPNAGISIVRGGASMSGGVTRTVSTSLQVPLPSVKPLEKIASWKHCANAVALLVSSHGSELRSDVAARNLSLKGG